MPFPPLDVLETLLAKKPGAGGKMELGFAIGNDGKPRDVVAQASKIGWLFIHDRETGELLRRSDPFVPQDNLVGKAAIILWSTDGSASWFKPWSWFTAARWSRIGGTF